MAGYKRVFRTGVRYLHRCNYICILIPDGPHPSPPRESSRIVVRGLPPAGLSVVNTVAAWAIFAVLVYLVWRFKRYMQRSYRRYAEQKAEAFSNAVSSAVASGVAKAAAAALADANASARSNVAVHVGHNLANLIRTDNDNDAMLPNADASGDRESRPADVGSLSDATRHRELASGRPLRRSLASRSRSGNLRSVTVESGEIE